MINFEWQGPNKNSSKENNNIHELYSVNFINAAKKYLDHPYDTNSSGADGGALREYNENKSSQLTNNFNGDVFESDKLPLVCTDLVWRSLKDIGFDKILDFSDTSKNWRNINNLEKEISKFPEYFEVIEVNSKLDFSDHSNLQIPVMKIGDIVSSSNTNGWRHVAIITETNESGFPIKAIHSIGHLGVAETSFFNTWLVNDKNKGLLRGNGAIPVNTTIDKVIRPKKKALEKINQ